jgi:hypothetical protein
MVRKCIAAAVAIALLASFARADEVQLVGEGEFRNGFDPAPVLAWRIGALELRDPHVYYSFGACLDVTDQLNASVQQQLDADSNGDGLYDSSEVEFMLPDDQHAFGSVDGLCTTASPSQCAPIQQAVPRWYGEFNVTAPTVCLGPLPDTTSGYTPPVPAPDGHCFATSWVDATIAFGTTSVPLWDTALAAPFPATTGSTYGGLMRGFLRESDADQITVDPGTGPVTLSSVLPGGAGSCATSVPNGIDSDRGEPGWWMYLEYRFDSVTLDWNTGP